MEKITANDILNALKLKHYQDVFVSECKDGPSGHGYVRMDAWVMKKSWAHPLTIGYEIKVSKSDFRQDNKWTNYLALCNEFYFVCPPHVIDISEVPLEAGLIYCCNGANRTLTKKKAPYRSIEFPEALFKYIVMCRAQIGHEFHKTSAKEFWEQWLKTKELNHEFGWQVSKAIREEIEKKVTKVENENKHLQKLMNEYGEIRELIASFGFDPNDEWQYKIKQRLGDLKNKIPQGLLNDLQNLKRDITNLEKEFATIGIKLE